MAKRKIIKINQDKCNGCGLCIPNCPEGALKIIDGKARLISDLFCDGLGACIGHCPEGAITVEERQAEAYDEKKVMQNIVRQGENVIKAHLAHLKDHHQHQYLKEAKEYLKQHHINLPLEETEHSGVHTQNHQPSECPGSQVIDFGPKRTAIAEQKTVPGLSQLRQWPVQIKLVPVNAPYFKDADLLFAADCVPFAYPDFHSQLLKGKVVLVGCPKLDDAQFYTEKITQIFAQNNIKSITCAHMEVPCCFGLLHIIKEALNHSGKKVPLYEVTVGIKGDAK